MKINLKRIDNAFHLEASNESGKIVRTDASPAIGGGDKGIRPMEMLLASLGSCSSIDIIHLLKKQRQELKDINISIEAEREKEAAEREKRLLEENPIKVGFGKKGFTLETRDGMFKTAIQWRFQFRYSYPYDSPPRSASDLHGEMNRESTFRIRRARIKVGGKFVKPGCLKKARVSAAATSIRVSSLRHPSLGQNVTGAGRICGRVLRQLGRSGPAHSSDNDRIATPACGRQEPSFT